MTTYEPIAEQKGFHSFAFFVVVQVICICIANVKILLTLKNLVFTWCMLYIRPKINCEYEVPG